MLNELNIKPQKYWLKNYNMHGSMVSFQLTMRLFSKKGFLCISENEMWKLWIMNEIHVEMKTI